MLVVTPCLHWGETIAGYNQARKNVIPLDIKFLLSLSDKALAVIEVNKDVFDKFDKGGIDGEGKFLYRLPISPREVFESRKADFTKIQNTYTWLSWNFADAYVKTHLANITVAATINH